MYLDTLHIYEFSIWLLSFLSSSAQAQLSLLFLRLSLALALFLPFAVNRPVSSVLVTLERFLVCH